MLHVLGENVCRTQPGRFRVWDRDSRIEVFNVQGEVRRHLILFREGKFLGK